MIWFVLGVFVGGIFGIGIMCLFSSGGDKE